jgi:hypothetical protein
MKKEKSTVATISRLQLSLERVQDKHFVHCKVTFTKIDSGLLPCATVLMPCTTVGQRTSLISFPSPRFNFYFLKSSENTLRFPFHPHDFKNI